MNNQEMNYISLHEAAKLTDYSQDYVSLLCRQRKLKGIKIGRNWVTTKEWAESYINRTKKNRQNIVLVKVEQENRPKDNKKDNLSPVTGKLILATIVCGLFVSGFIFLQLGFQKRAIKTNPSQAVKETSANAAKGIISISDFLDTIKNETAGLGKEKIIMAVRGISFGAGEFLEKTFYETPMRVGNSAEEKFSEITFALSEEIISLDNSLPAIKNESAKFAPDKIMAIAGSTAPLFLQNPVAEISNKIITLSNSLNSVSDYSRNNVAVSFESNSTRIKNNINNLTQPLRTKLARLSNSKNIIAAAISDKTKLGRIAGVSDNKSAIPDESREIEDSLAGLSAEQSVSILENADNKEFAASVIAGNPPAVGDAAIPNSEAQNYNTARNETNRGILGQAWDNIIGLSNFLGTIKSASVKFTANKIISLSGSLNTIKNESAKFAINEIDRLYYSLDFIKNKSEEKARTALSGLDGRSESRQQVRFADDNLPKAKTGESIDKLEREIIGDIQKRFDEFSGEQAAFLPPAASQNYGAAIVPYYGLEDKKKKVENLKESFSDEVSIEEDENGDTGTITPNIPGEDQKYLYLMVPMGK